MTTRSATLRFSDPDGPVVDGWNAQAEAHLRFRRTTARPHVNGMQGARPNPHSLYPPPPKLRLAPSADKDL